VVAVWVVGMRWVLVVCGVVAVVVLVWPAGASGPPPEPRVYPPPGVTAIGTGWAEVELPAVREQEPIARAVAAATATATPRAFANARARARTLAAAAGMRLGAVHSVAPETSGTFGWVSDPGTFGPGRYCGDIRVRRRSASGDVVRRSVHRCRSPREVVVHLAVTFEPAR
jgi:hypothetical protein